MTGLNSIAEGQPMEPVVAAATASAIMTYLLPAIQDLGARVIDRGNDSAADAIVRFGKQILDKMLHRHSEKAATREVLLLKQSLERRVVAVANAPLDDKPAHQLESAVEELLMVDSELHASLMALLEHAPKSTTQLVDRSSHIGGDNPGVVITGDGNTVIPRR